MRVSIGKLICIFLLVIFGAAPSFAQNDSENEPSKTILVFDASGSMWGQIDGEPKITISRSVLQTMLATWQPQNELGLIVYGHRRKGDCSDIEQIIAPGQVDAKAFTAAVEALNPKGKTPLSAAVKQAAQTLKYEENKATVILVTDGLETCNADPCAVASELEKLGVDFTTHVVGFDLSKEESKALQCIADNTGGQYFSASNAAELTTALQVVSKAVTKEFNLKLRGKVRKTSEVLTDGVSWEVYAFQDGKLADKYYTYSYSAMADFSLPAGKYQIKGVHGEAVVYQDVEVKDDDVTEVTILFGTGTLRVQGRAGPQSQNPVGREWKIFAMKDGEVADQYLTYSYRVSPSFDLPAGKYRIKGMYGEATKFKDVEVKVDETTDVTIVFNTGRLLLSGRGSATSQNPVGREWKIFAMKDGEVADQYLTYSYRVSPSFDLPAGKYRIKGMYGGQEYSRDIVITAGETQTIVMQFQ